MQDGKPVFVEDSGTEIAVDVPHLRGAVAARNAEAKTHREAKEALEAKWKGYEGLDDPVAARKALELAKNIDAGQLLTAGKVEELKASLERRPPTK